MGMLLSILSCNRKGFKYEYSVCPYADMTKDRVYPHDVEDHGYQGEDHDEFDGHHEDRSSSESDSEIIENIKQMKKVKKSRMKSLFNKIKLKRRNSDQTDAKGPKRTDYFDRIKQRFSLNTQNDNANVNTFSKSGASARVKRSASLSNAHLEPKVFNARAKFATLGRESGKGAEY